MITSISIRNFRSIEKEEFDCNWITTFVGENDAGKSNVLRALNLFFNGYTDPGVPFNFHRDFNNFATTRRQTAKQIEITVTFSLPQGYQRDDYVHEVQWAKVWRESGLFLDKGYRRYADRKDFPSRSKIPTLLDRIRFTYIPAIKDQSFFYDLQGQLYDVLASVAAGPLRESAANFEEQIQRQLEDLLFSINGVFDADSTLRLPDDLRTIFERLEISRDGIPLSRRGDGIKIRHIPMILKFIAEKHDNVLNRGGVRYTHIWGFEEPENNVEMSACFEMAKQFLEIVENSDRYQLFLTTHSPIIYTIEDPGEVDPNDDAWVHRYFVQKETNASRITQRAIGDIDKSMGLMPLVAPYIAQAKSEQDRLHEELKAAKAVAEKKLPTLFLEGKTDEIVLRRAMEIFASDSVNTIYIQAGGNDEYGSANALASRSLAWLLEMRHRSTGERVRALALFDGDNEGKKANKKLKQDIDNLKIVKGPLFKNLVLGSSERVRELRTGHFVFSDDLESYLDDDVWEVAEEKNWLEEIDDPIAGLSAAMVRNLVRTGVDPRKELDVADYRRLTKRFTRDGKVKAAKHVAKLGHADAERALSQFRGLVEKITGHLTPDS